MIIKEHLSDHCSYVFTGDSDSISNLFNDLKATIMQYKQTIKGTERQGFKVTEGNINDTRALCVDISFAHLEVRRVNTGCVYLSYNCYLDRQGWNYYNTFKIISNIQKSIQQLAWSHDYSITSRCTEGLPYAVSFNKEYQGIII